MSGACIPVEELARVAERPADDPARRHLERCPHCQTLLAMLRDFESSGERPAAAGFEAADPRLRATIAELTGIDAPVEVAGAEVAAPAGDAPAPRRLALPPSRPWWRRPMPRLAAGFAMLALVSVASVSAWRAHHAAPVMRAAPGQGAAGFSAREPRLVPTGLVLEWDALPEADAYVVVFLDGSLREVARTEPVTGTSFRLLRAALPVGLLHGATVGWQVEALAGNDRVRTTSTRSLRVP